MASWKRITAAAAAALLVAPAAATGSGVSIHSLPDVPSWQMPYELVFQVSVPGADIMPQRFSVVPLTTSVGLNQPDQVRGTIDIKADFALATDTSYVNIAGSNKIAYLCCDNLTSSFIDANTMFHALMDQAPAAILLYSKVGNCCGLSSTADLPYQNILTMVDTGDASQTVNITQASANVVRAEITGNATESSSSGTDGTGGVNNSAIAMSILYSITGLVTALFLIIIATGAVRAHRNPDRYGPRSGNSGRPRQSRAKGIARAVLETLPIIKFGDPTPAKPDPSMELESVPDSRPDVVMGRDSSEAQTHHLSAIPENAEAVSKAQDVPKTPTTDLEIGTKARAAPKEPDSGMGDASGAPVSRDSSSADDADHLGCSICTEDFLVGEDVRVLPCDHKFHPNCVDPWLVNVSGTCPLCRLDLHPNNTEDEPATTSDGQARIAPPLEAEETAEMTAAAAGSVGASGSTGRHRSSRLFDLHRLRHAPVEERIEALRRYRTENQIESQGSLGSASAATGGEDEHSRDKLTKRLRDKFRIRTRTQPPDGPSRS